MMNEENTMHNRIKNASSTLKELEGEVQSKMNEEKQIAKALLEAKKLHEASYVEGKAPIFGEYKRHIEECIQEAFEKVGLSTNLWALLNLAMHWWNDVELWCEDILADREISKGPYDEIPKEVSRVLNDDVRLDLLDDQGNIGDGKREAEE